LNSFDSESLLEICWNKFKKKKNIQHQTAKLYVVAYLGYLQQHRALYYNTYLLYYYINSTAPPGWRTSKDRMIHTTFHIHYIMHYDIITYYTLYIYIYSPRPAFRHQPVPTTALAYGYLYIRNDVNILPPTAVVGLDVLYGAQLSDDRRRVSRKHQKPTI